MDSTLKICLKAVGFLILVAVIQAISLYIVGAVYAVSSDTSFEEVMNVISTQGWELANEVIIPSTICLLFVGKMDAHIKSLYLKKALSAFRSHRSFLAIPRSSLGRNIRMDRYRDVERHSNAF